MTFKELKREVEKYLHVQGTSNEDLISGFINESILDLARRNEWDKLKKSEVITLDDSDTYDLTTLLTEFFHGELSLIPDAQEAYTKFSHEYYLQLENKTDYWAILGTTLYVKGTGIDINLQYISLGEDYPLTDDDDEVPATIYYWDIIRIMTVVKMLDYMGDEMVQKEEANLEKKIIIARNGENRIQKQGMEKTIAR